jgi:tetratricopeptide (TPR) repeat protein
VLKTGGENLDARLLRFRTNPASEDAGELAEQLLSRSRGADALEVLEARLEAAPGDVGALLTAGRAYLQIGELLKAQQALMQAAKLAPEQGAAYRWLGEVLLKRGDPERAAKVLAKAKALGGADPEVEPLLARATRLARLAEAELPGAFPSEPVTAKLASSPGAVPAPKVAAPPAPSRRLHGTQIGLGPVVAPAPRAPRAEPGAGLEEATVVAEDLRSQFADAMSQVPEARRRYGSLPDDFDDQPTSMMDRAMLDELSSEGFGVAPRGAKPAPRPAPTPPRPAPPRVSAPAAPPPPSRASIPASVPPPRAPAPLGAADEPVTRVASPLASRPEATEDPATRVAKAPSRRSAGGRAGPGEERGRAGEAQVDAILRVLEEERIFEPPASATPTWSEKTAKVGTRVGPMLAVVWVFGLLLAGGAYFGWRHWIDTQKAEARGLRDEAAALALRGDGSDLVEALGRLDRAHALHPTAKEGRALRVVLLAEQVLEGGDPDVSRLRPAIADAEREHVDGALLRAANAVVAFVEARPDRALELLGEDAEASDDPWVLYLRGRLLSRLGGQGAADVLQAATRAEPRLLVGELALVEIDAGRGERAAALERLERLLAHEPDHLRAQLFHAFLTSDTEAPDAVLGRVAALEPRLADAAPTDRALARVVEAHAARRKGDTPRALAAIERAAAEPSTSPALLVLVAREAEALGELGKAQRAAAAAVAAAPQDARARALLAEIALARGDAQSALRTLGALSIEDPEVLRLSARAALALGGSSLEAADRAMDAYLEANDGAPVEMRALALRMKARRGGASEALGAAERLVRQAPGDPDALVALAEVALGAREPAKARAAVDRLVEARPDDAEAQFLLGRAARMAGEAEPARAAFARALELSPTFGEAEVALGYLLLDMGRYEDAEALYQAMARGGRLASGGSLALVARLGRVEALLGLGRVADAKVQLEGVQASDAERAEARITAARVDLAGGRPADALGRVRPLAGAEGASADVIALYGDALYEANETTSASREYERALGLDAGHPEALLGYAQVLVRGEKYGDAETILERAREALDRRIRPPALRARYFVLLGKAQLERGDLDAARTSLREATTLAGAPAEAWFQLGEALSGANAPEARASYTRYLELAPDGPFAARARRAIR